MLRGNVVGLRPMQSKDSWLLHKWFNDQRVLEDLGADHIWFCVSIDKEFQTVDEMLASRTRRYFIIQLLEGSKDIGLIGLDKIDLRNASAEIQIIIGEVDCWDKGFGSEAIQVLLHHAFVSMNLHRVYLRVAEYNNRAKACYENCGFRLEGRLRHDHIHKGAFRDALIMSILKEEFRGRSDA
ncbi:MAG: GNAT family N-acetyltransferase [Methanomassiliicoccales archaeon]|nr:GNAT family N-acetyltransferase [Methanomassiliicoccales archaeon]